MNYTKKMIERIHIIIGIVLFFLLAGAAASQGLPSGWPPLTKEQEVVALTLMGEARGEGSEGLYAVGCVIEKRVVERKLTLSKVCLQNRMVKGRKVWQFSCWEDKRYMETMKRLLKAGTKEAEYSKALARAMTKGDLEQTYTGHANHYHADYVSPSWADKFKPTKKIGRHYFYKLPWAIK